MKTKVTIAQSCEVVKHREFSKVSDAVNYLAKLNFKLSARRYSKKQNVTEFNLGVTRKAYERDDFAELVIPGKHFFNSLPLPRL